MVNYAGHFNQQIEHSHSIHSHFSSLDQAKSTPTIVSELENMTVRLGEPFELRVEIKATPTPIVQWMKGKFQHLLQH